MARLRSVLVLVFIASVHAWRWDSRKGLGATSPSPKAVDRPESPWYPDLPPYHSEDSLKLADSTSGMPNIYTVAAKELEALQSEPLCHRIAARLLISDCQMLDGKDEATILTESGRRIRDFVDFYAASLAICDLRPAQSIHLYQRITKILEKLTNEVDEEMREKMHLFGDGLREASKEVEELSPIVHGLKDRLGGLKALIFEDLGPQVEAMDINLQKAADIKHVLSILLATILEAHAEISAVHNMAMNDLSERVDHANEGILASFSTTTKFMDLFNGRLLIHDAQLVAASMQVHALTDELGNAISMTKKMQEMVVGSASVTGWNLGLIIAGEGIAIIITMTNELVKSLAVLGAEDLHSGVNITSDFHLAMPAEA
ncbi:unnamed protein product [Parascedosporium putredinis]|uniref:Uncharacterized protein n=1 Tax=Parascedosporium putredinis TaxID=1442378 RepID=A0A9P1HCV8_9PEZI|nr:unnamed protein product [Parascedosporium putredinis]CAI8003728.1 unnamed protein product [Parascedosporium putredinis]